MKPTFEQFTICKKTYFNEEITAELDRLEKLTGLSASSILRTLFVTYGSQHFASQHMNENVIFADFKKNK